jgi:hypothetical protein
MLRKTLKMLRKTPRKAVAQLTTRTVLQRVAIGNIQTKVKLAYLTISALGVRLTAMLLRNTNFALPVQNRVAITATSRLQFPFSPFFI